LSLESLPEIEPPVEILEIQTGETKRLRVVRFERGKTTIHPRWLGAPESRIVEALRLHLEPGSKATWPPYYDATAKTLVPQLLAIFRTATPGWRVLVIDVGKVGLGPAARFPVSLVEVVR